MMGDSGKYEYSKLNPYQIRKVLGFVRKGFYGRAWQLLRRYPCEKLHSEAKGCVL